MVPCGEFIGAEKFVLLVHDTGGSLHGPLQEGFAGVFKTVALSLLFLVSHKFLDELLDGTLRDVGADVVRLIGLGEGVQFS